jgi:mannosyltransferase OCH1-like enzyme
LNAGTSIDNIKIISLDSKYKNPSFFPRKFEKWPDEFEIKSDGDGKVSVRRTDVKFGGWGETLLIDVEYETENIQKENLTEQKIPRIIYQTFETMDVPDGMYKAINSWRETNTDYEHYLYDANSRVEFIETFFGKNVLDAYLNLIPGAFKADLWRCCVLYEKGGVYVDADMICLKKLREYITPTSSFITCRDDPISTKYLANGFIASVPKHPFLKEQIDAIVKNVEANRKCYYLEISGPALLGQSVNKICGRDPHTPYELGENSINNFSFDVMLHDWKTKTMSHDGSQILITEYSKKLEEMSKIKNPTFYSLYQKGIVYKQIPRNIYYTSYDHVGINPYMVESFSDKNKHWSLSFYSDLECVKFFEKYNIEFISLVGINALEFYSTLTNGGERSDFWRYCVLYLFGGVYTDTDTFCAEPLENWTHHHDLILGIEAILPLDSAITFGMDKVGQTFGNMVISVCNWTMAAKPRHEFFKNLIAECDDNQDGYIDFNEFKKTMTGMLLKEKQNL